MVSPYQALPIQEVLKPRLAAFLRIDPKGQGR